MRYQQETSKIHVVLSDFWGKYSHQKCPNQRLQMASEMVATCRIKAPRLYGEARLSAGCGSDLAILEYLSRIAGIKPQSGVVITVPMPELSVLSLQLTAV